MHQTRYLKAAGPFIFCLLVAGCGKSDAVRQNEEAAQDVIAHFEGYADALESIKDKETAKQAAIKINAINDQFEKLIAKKNTFPKIPKRDNDRLEKEYLPKIKAATDRMEKAILRAALKSQGEPTFLAAMNRLEQLAKRATL